MHKDCVLKLSNQVQTEINAALTYFTMGSYFARDVVNRPGFSKFFFESASEEREHAMKIIHYLLMRGPLVTKEEYEKHKDKIYFEISNLLSPRFYDASSPVVFHKEIFNGNNLNGTKALALALELEVNVTKSINDIIRTCEEPEKGKLTQDDPTKNINDYHLVDYLTTDFLEEQFKGQRDIAGKLATLNKMMSSHADLAEFLFDKKLLNGEI